MDNDLLANPGFGYTILLARANPIWYVPVRYGYTPLLVRLFRPLYTLRSTAPPLGRPSVPRRRYGTYSAKLVEVIGVLSS